MIVEIPIKSNHMGNPMYLRKLEISDYCPKCRAKRGVKRWRGFSFDGSRRLVCSCWENECGHIDKYKDVAKEALKKEVNHE